MSDRCSLCTGNRIVKPVGRTDARIMLVGEGPGKNEDKDGIPFVGVSGREQDHTYFGLAGIQRSDVFISNCILCRCERGGADVRPSNELVKCCAEHHLVEEICEVQPEIIVLAGATASSLFGINLELEHGFPQKCENLLGTGVGAWLVPMYHPAAGIRETRYMIPLLDDWEKFGKWLRGEWEPPKIEEYQPDYRLVNNGNLIGATAIAEGDWIAIDTESDEGKLYSIQFSFRRQQAFMILQDGFEWFKNYVLPHFRTVILHNAVYDLAELASVGIHITNFRDTMQELYHLGGSLPQGLKAAVYRIFGFRMTSYDDVVTPASLQKLDNWLAEALAFSSQSMRYSISHTKGKGCAACGKNHRVDRTEYKPHESEAVIRRVMKHIEEGEDYDPWKPPTYAKGDLKLRLIGRDWLRAIEDQIGRMPRPSIVHAPIDRQIQYACGDADWTGQLATWLDSERKRIVNAEWRVN